MPKRPKPKYGHLRVGREKKYSLDEKTRQRLLEVVGEDRSVFVEELELLVSKYQLRCELERQIPTASEIRTALEKLDATANRLLKILDQIDTDTVGLVHFHLAGDDVVDRLMADLEQVILATQEAKLSPQIGSRGRPPRFALDSLASGLAVAFNKHLTVRPTKTRGGKFEQCLRIVLEAAGAHETVDFPGDLFPIVSQAIDGVRNTPNKG